MTAIPTEMSVIEVSAPGGPEVLKPARRAVPKPANCRIVHSRPRCIVACTPRV